MRHFDRDFALTNRLRTEGTDHLLSAGRAVGVRRFVAQSAVYGFYARTGGAVKSEEDPLDPSPPREIRESAAAIRHLEEAVLGAKWTEGIVLRYGAFYGPGTSMSAGGEQFEMVRRRKFPLVGSGAGVWSFVHIADAAEATVAAVDHGRRGIYNVVDDDPAPVADWLPALAQALGAKKPMRVPRFIGRLFAGEAGAMMMTEVRGGLPDARKRLRGRGRGAGGAAAGASGARGRRADRIAARVRGHRDHPAGDQRVPLRAGPPRDLCRGVAAGADHHRCSR